MADRSRLQELSAAGVSVWIDSLSREMLDSGAARRADGRRLGRRRHLEPDDLPEGARRGRPLRRAAARGRGGDRRPDRDLLRARDGRHPRGMRPDAARLGADGRDRRLRLARGRPDARLRPRADVRAGACGSARRSTAPNLYVKIPATEPGLGAIEDCIAKGVSINVTLIFSLERYAAVAEAYLRGLERLVAGGGDPSKVLSVASFFVSRVDTEADKRLEALGRTDLQGKLAVANAKLAYQHYLDVVLRRPLGLPRGEGRAAAALPVGVDLGEEPRLPRRDLRRGADRARHRQHDAARDGARVPGSRRGRSATA